ncbi:hypothetical protein VPH35_096998 [Triticum aestivum]|uniref:UV radiation resistance-associated gene protein n=1 Tax=Triticum aestivum TaxID=4565 RepID=A0A3B6MP91_WHEAT|nr:uncharacterized protein LOC123120435 [Triticum aestivum]
MDPGPSSASADPSPPEEEEEEEEEEERDSSTGSTWVFVPGSEVLGADAPKVVGWEELQQELARLWSLSAALAAARDRKAGLAARLESALEARKAVLQQDNELAEMRQRLQSHADFMGELRMQTKEVSANVDDWREQLCVKIRTLTVADKTVGAAQSKLQEPCKLLSGEHGHGRLKGLERMLRMRQQYMIGQVAQIYPVRPLNEQSPIVKPGLNSSITRTGVSEAVSPNGYQNGQAPLAILGLQLSKLSIKKTSYFSDKTEIQKSATLLGYVAHAVSLIASYLDVPLRYPLRLGGSHSYIVDHAPSVDPSIAPGVSSSTPSSTSMRTMEFPLFFEGQETTRSAYAVFLLNKDVEQLLNHIGAESLGPRHVLANLKQLTTIVQSQQYISD